MPSQNRPIPFKPTDVVATIHIRNLRLRTFIGFNPEEQQKQQDVIINIEVRHRVSGHALRDQVDEALNYKTITKQVIALVEEGRFLLLEKLVADVLSICSEHPSVLAATVTVDKPYALRFADSVALSLEFQAGQQGALRAFENQQHNYLEKAS